MRHLALVSMIAGGLLACDNLQTQLTRSSASYLVQHLSSDVLSDEELREGICHQADRLVVVKASQVTVQEATVEELEMGFRDIYTSVDFVVERHSSVDGEPPPEEGINLLFQGGRIGQRFVIASGMPEIEVGDRWAFAFGYRGAGWDIKNPWLIASAHLKSDFDLPTQEDLDQAKAEYCGVQAN